MEQDHNCHVEPKIKHASADELGSTRDIQLAISGMGCINCANRVRNGLLSLEGVIAAEVDHRSALAFIRYNPTMVEVAQLAQAVVQAGGDGRHEYLARVLTQN